MMMMMMFWMKDSRGQFCSKDEEANGRRREKDGNLSRLVSCCIM